MTKYIYSSLPDLFQLVNCSDDENDMQVDQIAVKIKKETKS